MNPVYLKNGAIERDNNLIENAIRHLPLGEIILLCFIPFLQLAKK